MTIKEKAQRLKTRMVEIREELFKDIKEIAEYNKMFLRDPRDPLVIHLDQRFLVTSIIEEVPGDNDPIIEGVYVNKLICNPDEGGVPGSLILTNDEGEEIDLEELLTEQLIDLVICFIEQS